MRKLATIRKITSLDPIPGADKIEVATVDGWKVVVAKDEGHKVGDYVVYCEIDSFLPVEPEFEFLRKSSYRKTNDGDEGFRLRTIKLRGQVSQGLIIPLKDAETIAARRGVIYAWEPGQDITEDLGITKWDPPLPANLVGKAKGYFPSFITKTDEERIQNLVAEYEDYKANQGVHGFYITEKLDGSSATFFINDGKFGVCNRNLELAEPDDVNSNTFWKIARELDIETKLRKLGRNIAIQGELIGAGIQKNPYKLKGHTVRFFNVFDIDKFEKVGYDEFINVIVNELGLQTVPVTSVPGKWRLPESVEELITRAHGHSWVCNTTVREGIVIRSRDNKISFKVINNTFLLNED